MKVTMSWAHIGPSAKKNVNAVLASGWLSRHHYIPIFEEAVAQKHHAKHGILVSSGTDALRIALATLKEIHRWPSGSGVIVPALTFVATVNAILQNGLTPIFADVEERTGNIDLGTVQYTETPGVKAIIPVHLFGLPVDMKPLWRSKQFGSLSIVEDSCETFGVHALSGDMACFSFYMSHHISTGVGGMILTSNDKYASIARSYMNHGRIDDGTHFQFGRSGFSSRITEMEAAIGISALERFDKDLWKRRRLAWAYMDALSAETELKIAPNNPFHSWMFFPIRLINGKREKLMEHLRKAQIESREAMPLINQPVFKELYTPGSCPNAEFWTTNGMLLPLHPLMTEKDVAYVCKTVKRFFA